MGSSARAAGFFVGCPLGGRTKSLALRADSRLQAGSPLFTPDPLPLKGVISLDGVNDLERSLELGGRTDILSLLGVTSATEAVPLFDHTSPARLIPFGMPQVLILWTLEDGWRREMTVSYAEAATRAGDTVRLLEPEGLDHFDVVDPLGPALALVSREALALADAP